MATAEAVEFGLSAHDLYRLIDHALIGSAIRSLSTPQRKPNQSQIAAQTGLSRPEVRSLLKNNGKLTDSLQTWRWSRVAQTHRYLVRQHLPQNSRSQQVRVRYDGTLRSFINAVNAVGGDIPPAAILKEFMRRGIASIVYDKKNRKTVKLLSDFPVKSSSPALDIVAAISRAFQSKDSTLDAGPHTYRTICNSELEAQQFLRRVHR